MPALRATGLDVAELAAPALDPWRFDRRAIWDQALLPLSAARADVDVLHCTAGTMPLVATAPIVVTVHDVAWLRVQTHARPYARAYFGAYMLARYRAARGIVVDSSFSRDELLAVAPELDPARVAVVFPGVAEDVMRVERARDDAAPFVLAVGTVEPRKNLEVLVRALVGLPRLRLVSLGPPTPYRERCLALARELGVAGRVEIRGYVPRSEVLRSYAGALVAAVPSRYEGFGYGAAQALCAGVPLVSSDASSAPGGRRRRRALGRPGRRRRLDGRDRRDRGRSRRCGRARECRPSCRLRPVRVGDGGARDVARLRARGAPLARA